MREKKQKYYDDLTKHKAVIAENQKLHEVNYNKVKGLRAELDKLSAKRDELNKEYTEKKKQLDAKWVVYKQEQEVIKKQKNAEYKERKEREKKEKEEEEELRKMEEANKPPMLKEFTAVETLIAYLDNLNYNKKKPASKINHSLDAFGQFSEFNLVPPQRTRDVESAKTALAAKKEEILVLQAAALKKRQEEAAAKEAEAAAAPPAEESAKEEPAEEPTAEEPAAEEPVTEEPVAEEPAAEEPVAPVEEAAATEEAAPAEEVAEEAPAATED